MVYPGLHFRNKITRVPMAVCLLDLVGGSSFRFDRRVEELIPEEIKRSQYNAHDEDDYIGGSRNRHGKKTKW